MAVTVNPKADYTLRESNAYCAQHIPRKNEQTFSTDSSRDAQVII